MSSNTILFIVLGGSFLAVGIHLLLWSRRTRARFQRFAREKNLPYMPSDRDGLENQLEEAFGLRRGEDEAVRGFSRVKDIIPFDGGNLFRTVEILDLTRFSTSENTHSARAAVMADAPQAKNLRGIFQMIPGRGVRQRYPLSGTDQSTAVSALLQSMEADPPPCALTISFAEGRALAYLEPTVVGAVTADHLDFLLRLGRRLAKRQA